jgi:hypothetical protein
MSEQLDDQQVKALVTKAIRMLDRQIEDSPDPLLFFVPPEQLMVMKSNFEKIAAALDRGPLPPRDQRSMGMAREVIEEWPFTYLGEAIVKAERAYESL